MKEGALKMHHARIARILVLSGLLIIWCLIPIQVYSDQKTSPSPTIVETVKPPAGMQQTPSFVRGTVMTSSGKGLKDIEVSLFMQECVGGKSKLIGKKMTDPAGHYAFMVLPDKKGKKFRVTLQLPKQCCSGCCILVPAMHTFILQKNMTADFKIETTPLYRASQGGSLLY
ncbi:MAG TPA: hypothetical protein DDY17_11295 [Syntrophaceae bacterium]|jgi:hypothetical protein|nr:hypothetical protein [Syntrophaceae bacterium]